MRLLVTILFAGLLFSQSASDMERISKDIDDLGSKLRKYSRTYSDGYSGGIVFNEAQLDEVKVLWLAEYDLVGEAAGCYKLDADVEVVKAQIDSQVFVLLEYLLRTDDGVVFYYKNKPDNIQRVRDIISLLRPKTE